MKRFLGTCAAVAVVTPLLSVGGTAAATATDTTAQDYIVVLTDGASAASAASRHGVVPTELFDTSLDGYRAALNPAQVAAVQRDPQVVSVLQDRVLLRLPQVRASKKTPPQFPQIVTDGVERVGTLESPTAAIDGHRDDMDVDIAIIDSGVDPKHVDLNVRGGVNCSSVGSKHDFHDGFFHGTAVSGLAAARDNAIGVVGVAPGARIWAVKISDNEGNIELSWLLCGIEWATKHAGRIEIANLSLGDPGLDDRNCGRTNGDVVHRAVCRLVRAGVTTVVAAGNESSDAATEVPASYDEVITVSALADTDGIPGGLDRDGFGVSDPNCLGEKDDTFADFSNFGQDVDIAAPGVCLSSTYPGSQYVGGISGTSFSAPLVAGGAALYKSRHPRATPARVKQALIDAGSFDWNNSDDPDGIKEPLLNVASF